MNTEPARRAEPTEEQVNEVARVLKAAWDKAEPEHGVTLYPASYMATFADMARAVLAMLPLRVAPSREVVSRTIDHVGWDERAEKFDPDRAAGAIAGLFASQPTVAEVRAEAWGECVMADELDARAEHGEA